MIIIHHLQIIVKFSCGSPSDKWHLTGRTERHTGAAYCEYSNLPVGISARA